MLSLNNDEIIEVLKKDKKSITKDEIHALIDPYKWLILMTIIFFISAGRIDIPRAWLFFSILLIGSMVGSVLVWKFNREVLKHRVDIPKDTKSWDKLFLPIYFFLTLVITPVIAGLDVGRFYWSNLNISFMIIGIIIIIISYILILWSMAVNLHFEGTARIQKDREHQVIRTGPYKMIRHPGYLGMIFGQIALPFIIGSFFALIPAGIAIVAIIIRTFLEDKMLQNELDGYSEYAKKVKYRLFPGIL